MRKDIVTSAIGIVVLTLLLGILYPLIVTGVSQITFPGNANGQKVYVGVKPVGSKLVGQSFQTQVVKNGKPQVTKTKGPVLVPDPKYFQSRPSGTGEPYTNGGTPYNAARTSGPTTQRPSRQSPATFRATSLLSGRTTRD
jgi:potassium-transporting ATPase KdpC subunit